MTRGKRQSLQSGVALAFALLAFALPAAAEKLYKCVDAAGISTIQQERCPKGSTQAWARDTAPEPPPTPEQIAAAQARAEAARMERARVEAEAQERARQDAEAEAAALAQAEAEAEATDTGSAAKPPSAVAPDQCDKAKEFAAQLRQMPWLELEPHQVQKVFGWVVQQCAEAD